MERGLVAILLLIAVLVVSTGSVYLYYKNKDKDLNTPIQQNYPKRETDIKYTNEELGFEFIVPLKDFLAGKDSEENFNKRGNGNFRKNFSKFVGYEPAKVVGAIAVLDKERDFDKSPLTIWVFENPDNLEADRWYKKFWYYPFVWGDFDATKEKIKPIKEASISGKFGKFGLDTYRPGKPKFIYLSEGGKMFLFRVLTENNVGEQILSTFKFLE